MNLLRIYRFALILMTVALVAVSAAYIREHRQLKTWETAGTRLNVEYLTCTVCYSSLTPSPIPDYCRYDSSLLQQPTVLVEKVINRNQQWDRITSRLYEQQSQEADKRIEVLEADLKTAQRRSAIWEKQARTMSREADRCHLDKNFPQVHIPEGIDPHAASVMVELQQYRTGIPSRLPAPTRDGGYQNAKN